MQALAREKSTLERNDQVPKCQKPRKQQNGIPVRFGCGKKKIHFAVQRKKPRYNAGFVNAKCRLESAQSADEAGGDPDCEK